MTSTKEERGKTGFPRFMRSHWRSAGQVQGQGRLGRQGRGSHGLHTRSGSVPETNWSVNHVTDAQPRPAPASRAGTGSEPRRHWRSLSSSKLSDNTGPRDKKTSGSATMDFSSFRESGELSDIAVTVEGREFRLHKFPLYIRSDFFRALARKTLAENDHVTLTDFPGGATTFELIANYCYNKRIDITRENVCRLRCGAEFLQMCSPGNLADCCDRFLKDLLTSLKLNRDVSALVDLLVSCRHMNAIIEQTAMVSRCLEAIVESWLLSSSRWTRRMASNEPGVDEASFAKVTGLPLDWFKQLVTTARDKNVRPAVLAQLAQMYISHVWETTTEGPQRSDPKETDERQEKKNNVESGQPENDKKIDGADSDDDDDDSDEAGKESADGDELAPEKEIKQEEKGSTVDEKRTNPKQKNGEQKVEKKPNPDATEEKLDLRVVMDTILLELPEGGKWAGVIDPQWSAAMLKVAQELDCQCRDFLLKVVSRQLTQVTPSILGVLSPDLLRAVLQQAARDPSRDDQNVVCSVIDNYLLGLAEKDDLDLAVFAQMVESVPNEQRPCHDTLFLVLEKLLSSDKHKVLSDEDKQKLLDTVDFERLSEATLQRANNSHLVPSACVTRAALALCARLRGELDAARDVIRAREKDLERLRERESATWRPSGGAGGAAWSARSTGGSAGYGGYKPSLGREPDWGNRTGSSRSAPKREIVMTSLADEQSDISDPVDRDLDYSPPGFDPILAKALGGSYYDDPLSLDSHYPLGYRSVYDRYTDDRESAVTYSDPYRRMSSYASYSPLDPRYYSSSRW